MSLLEQDKSVLSEKISFVQAELDNTRMDVDRLKREGQTNEEQARNGLNNLNSELKKVVAELEENRYDYFLSRLKYEFVL